jgi:hypothetical protein
MNRRDILATVGGALYLGRTLVTRVHTATTIRHLGALAAVPSLPPSLAGCGEQSTAEGAAAPKLPAWLAGAPALQWIRIANTAMTTINSSPDYHKLTNAGLAPWTNWGDPQKGIYAYSGGTLKGGNTMVVFGGGGANAWAGNEIRTLDLSADAPVWRIPVAPSPTSTFWPQPEAVGHLYNKDGLPVSRHTYFRPQFIDSHGPYANSFFCFGVAQTWYIDGDLTYPLNATVDSLDWATATWRPAGTHPPISQRSNFSAGICKHPTTEKVYVPTSASLEEWDPLTNTWSKTCNTVGGITYYGMGAVDPYTETFLRIGPNGGIGQPFNAHAVDLATKRLTVCTLSGPGVASIQTVGFPSIASGFVYDPGLRCFLLFQGNGALLKITANGPTDWYVDYLVTTGTAPPVDISLGGHQALCGRMEYVPALKGICIIFAYNQDAYFLRTTP